MPSLEAAAGGDGGAPNCDMCWTVFLLQALASGCQERPGRVLLGDFYRPALDQAFAESASPFRGARDLQGTLEFTESAEFLRQQGATWDAAACSELAC